MNLKSRTTILGILLIFGIISSFVSISYFPYNLLFYIPWGIWNIYYITQIGR